MPAEVTAPFVRKNDRRLEREQAGKWALDRLAAGPVEANVLFDEAAAFGFSQRTVRRALSDLGLKPRKSGNDGPWLWGQRVQGAQRAPRFGVQERDGCPSSVASCPLQQTMVNGLVAPAAIQNPESKSQNSENGQLATKDEVESTATVEGKLQIANCELQIGNREEATPSEDQESAGGRQSSSGQLSVAAAGGRPTSDGNGNPKSKIENPKSLIRAACGGDGGNQSRPGAV